HQRNREPGVVQPRQRDLRELGGSCKTDPHRPARQTRASSRVFFSILVLMRSRLSELRYSTNTLPIKWSISCWTQIASSPSASNSTHSPERSIARTLTHAWRLTLS